MKKFLGNPWVVFIVLAICALSALLSGCGADAGGGSSSDTVSPDTGYVNDNGEFEIHHIPVDGRTVSCIYVLGHGGLSCDWANAK